MIKRFAKLNLSLLMVGAMSLVCLASAEATEVRLKATCNSSGSLLLLGDVAEIYSNDTEEADRLAATPLTPAPAPGKKRFLRGREIQDMLVGRGVNVGELRFSGANQVTVETLVAVPVAEPVVAAKPVERTSTTPPLQIANEAILNYLHTLAGTEVAFDLEFQLSANAASTLRNAAGDVTVTGGEEPLTGEQQFTLIVPTANGEVELPLSVSVSVPQAVVVVVRALPKGSILRAEDLKLVEQASHQHVVKVEESFHSLEQVIGKETQKSISPGQILDKNYVRSQLLVRRGEVVTVYARAAGIRVRTTGRALSDGSLGDLIAIETLETGTREKFDARITEAQVVEVWAGSTASGK